MFLFLWAYSYGPIPMAYSYTLIPMMVYSYDVLFW